LASCLLDAVQSGGESTASHPLGSLSTRSEAHGRHPLNKAERFDYQFAQPTGGFMSGGNAASPAGFDPVPLACHLLRTVRAGALATIDRETGGPFATLVTVATDYDGSPLLLVSGLSAHAANLDADPRASILLAAHGRGDPLAHPRLTVTGRVERSTEPRIRRRFLARNPKAELYADFPDFSFRRMTVDGAHLNGGFARAARLGPAELLTDLTGADALIEAEEGAVAHMNADHADALGLYAVRLAGAPDGNWRATGCDPDGMDLAAGDLTARLPFPERVTDAGSLRRVLVGLARDARLNDETA
jgi:putative heme iron utilization protein